MNARIAATNAAAATTTASTTATADETPRSHRARILAAVVALVAAFAALVTGALPASAAASYGVNHHRTYTEDQIAWKILGQINSERRAHHLKPVTMSSDLMLSARRHDMDMAHFNEMSHQLPREAFFANRMTAAGYRWTMAGENIAWNSRMTLAGVEQVQSMMYNEKAPYDGHRLNILNSKFRNVGVDVYLDTVHHKIWLTTDFGRP